MNLFSKFFLFVAVILSLVLVKNGVEAQETTVPENVVADVTKFNDYYRFSFKSPDYNPFDMLIDGDDIVIDFERANNLDLAKYIYDDSVVRSFGSSGDGKSYVIRVNGDGAKARKFIGDDNTTGFDLFITNEQTEKKTILMSALPGEEEAADGETAALTPANKFAKVQIITYPPEFVGPPKVEQLLNPGEEFVGAPQYDNKRFAVYEVMKLAEKGSIIPEIEVDNNGFVLSFPLTDIDSVSAGAMIENDRITIVFNSINNIQLNDITPNPFISRVTRVQDPRYRIVEIELNKKKVSKAQYAQSFSKTDSAWVLNFYKDDGKAKKKAIVDTNPLAMTAEINFNEKRVVAKADSVVGPVNLTDAETGNKIKAFLIKDNSVGVILPREFVDLKVLPSLQGIFLEEKSDYLSYDNNDKRLIITKLNNMQISDEVISTESETKNAMYAASRVKGVFLDDSLFPFPLAVDKTKKTETKAADKKEADAKADEEEEEEKESAHSDKDKKEGEEGAEGEEELADLDEEEQQYTEKIVKNEDITDDPDRKDITNTSLEYLNRMITAFGEKKTESKLALANFYFTKGLYAESLGILQDLKLSDPGFKEMFKVDAMIAATQYFTGKYGEAFEGFTNIIEKAEKNKTASEIMLWQWASKHMYNMKRRNNEDAPIEIDFVSSYDKFMQQYPLKLRYSMGLMYLDDMLKASKIDQAKNVMDIISFGGVPEEYAADTKFYRAYLADKEGDNKFATKLYTQLVNDPTERKNRAKAMVELTKNQLLKSEITNDKAIEKFLQAATIWRDDYFEMDVLEIVGHLYVSEKNYIKALENWKQIANNFPETTESVFILGKMKQLFIDLFDGGIAYKMKPLETLKLYFGFRELTPAGEVGDRITRKVAQFFVTADMMDEAIKIVEHQIKYRSTGDDKAKLALSLYKMNLDNRDIDGAETALNMIPEQGTSQNVLADKHYAQAYLVALRKDYDDALGMIANDFSSPAQKVRTELFWQKQNWFGVMNTIEARLNDIRETKPLPLTKDELNDINRLLVAYAAQGENKKLQAIRNEFASRIPTQDDELLFDYLTRGSIGVDYNNFENTVELGNMEKFLNEYSFLPGKDWHSVIAILEPKVGLMVGKTNDELTRDNKLDIVKLAIAYSMLVAKDDKEASEMKKKIGDLARDFKDIRVDRFTIDAFNIFDDKFMPKENDAVFEGKIKLTDITQFLDYYRRANKFSELNMSIRDKFTQ